MKDNFVKTIHCNHTNIDSKTTTTSNSKESKDNDIIYELTSITSDIFLEKYWEKSPVHFIATNQTNSIHNPLKSTNKDTIQSYNSIINEKVFSKKKLLSIIKDNELSVDTNLSAVKYIKKVRISRSFGCDIVTSIDVKKSFEELYTIQVLMQIFRCVHIHVFVFLYV